MERQRRLSPGGNKRETRHTSSGLGIKTPGLPPTPANPDPEWRPPQLRPPDHENPMAPRPRNRSRTRGRSHTKEKSDDWTPSRSRYSDPGQSPMQGQENEGKSYFGNPCMSNDNYRCKSVKFPFPDWALIRPLAALQPRAYNRPDPSRASSLPGPSFAEVHHESKKKSPLLRFKSTFSSIFKKDEEREKGERVEEKHWTDEDY